VVDSKSITESLKSRVGFQGNRRIEVELRFATVQICTQVAIRTVVYIRAFSQGKSHTYTSLLKESHVHTSVSVVIDAYMIV
jgi:hypothetical protein